jgi:hypothetical protein
MFNSVIGELISVLGMASGLPGDLMAQITSALGSATIENVIPSIAPAGQSPDAVSLPVPTAVKKIKAPPDDGFRELTTATKSGVSAIVPVVVVEGASGIPTTVPWVEILMSGTHTKMPVISDPPGLLDGANAGGLRLRRRRAEKEEG